MRLLCYFLICSDALLTMDHPPSGERGRGREDGGTEGQRKEGGGERREGGRKRERGEREEGGRREEGMRALPSEALAPSFIICPVLPSSGTAKFHTDYCSAQHRQQQPGPWSCDSLSPVIELWNNEVCHQHKLTWCLGFFSPSNCEFCFWTQIQALSI